MPFDADYYPLDTVTIPLGSSLADAEALLPDRTWWPPYGGWPNLRGACPAVFGLAATECNLRAPARHKPVMQVSYELAPPPAHRGPHGVDAAYWVAPLTQLLGPPDEATAFTEAWRTGAGNVVYSAVWRRAALRLSLSVYGGIRREEGRAAAAGLYLDWDDVVAAARPLYAAARAQEAALNAVASQVSAPLRIRTKQAQTAATTAGYGPVPAYPTPEQTLERQSRRALHLDGLCETPAHFQAQLPDHEVALWPVPGRAEWAVSTRWDTVLLTAEGPPVELLTLQPARGGGALVLAVGDLTLHDAYNSTALPKLATALEKRVGCSVSRVADYDA